MTSQNYSQSSQRGHGAPSPTPSGSNRPMSIARKPVPVSPRSSVQITPASQQRASEYSSISIDSYYGTAPVDSARSTPVRKPVERRDPDQPRLGVMKTAGNTELGTSNSVATGEPMVPEFDFGPTINLSSANNFQLNNPSNDTPLEVRPNSRNAPNHIRNDSTDSNGPRSSTWGPAGTKKPAEDLRGLGPGAFVQRQAPGADALRDPKSRSTDNLLQRPSSRGAAGMNTNGNRSSQHLPAGGGLVGAIEAREREKKDLKQGINSQALRQAIVQQQRQSPNIYDQRNSQILAQGMAPNFHQQTQQFVQQQSQFSKTQYQQPYSPQFIAQPFSPMGPNQFPQRGQSSGYGQAPVEGQYQQQPQQGQGYMNGNGNGRGGAYQGRGNGY